MQVAKKLYFGVLVLAGWIINSVEFKLGNAWAGLIEPVRAWGLHQSSTSFSLIVL
jgi:hypothetical protein